MYRENSSKHALPPEGTAGTKPNDVLFSLPNGKGIRGCLIKTRNSQRAKGPPASANSAPRTLGSADPQGTSYTRRQLEITDDRRGPR